MRSRINLAEKVPNKDRRFGAALEYYPVKIVTGRRSRDALFTPSQISEAIARAESNLEDIPLPGFWQKVWAWLAAR
jgi:hypothetical protein